MDAHIGVDEVGRGCFAGPMLVCGVVPRSPFPAFRDSKKYTEADRASLYPDVLVAVQDFEVRWADNRAIDDSGLQTVWHDLVRQVVDALRARNGYLLAVVDGNVRPRGVSNVLSMVKGDEKDPVIAAASIIAKVTRDGIMEELDEFFPEYGFAVHKGYGVPGHVEALKRLGPTPIHRNLFLRNMRSAGQLPAG